jgi:hypothetical protein
MLNITASKTLARSARVLLVGCSGLALSAPLAANQLLFTTSEARPETGQRIDQRGGLTQIALTGGGTVSIVDAAEYRINEDGSIDLYEGSITVASGATGEVVVRMPEGLEGRVAGAGAAGNFSARKNGEASGHALTGVVRIGRAGSFEQFAAGEMWRARGQGGARRVVANAAQVQPETADRSGAAVSGSVVPIGGEAGPIAAALNGIPTGFGDQLAAAGASSDIIAAARRIEAIAGNPAIENFPSGDFALLVAAAARLEGSYGGTPFPQAQADIIRAYLRFLAGGGAGSNFLSAYSGFVVNYLDLIRSGGLPSGFSSATPGDVEAYLAYIRRTGALSSLASRDRVLADAYLVFLANGGDRDLFAASFTDLTIAYFAFVRGGGDPAEFTGATQAALAQTIAFLRDSGLVVQLSATDRALVEAFLANGGLAFAGQYEAALSDYFDYLAGGRLPSEYPALDQATLRAYLETLADTGLLEAVLGNRAGFYADYLAFLRAGGEIDAFAGLPANIFAGYALQLDAYFAFLATGRLPSEFDGTDIATLQAWLLELQAAGALERFLGDRAAFFAQFAAFVAGGGTFDGFAGLPANIFAGYAVQLDAYFAFLASGRLPSEFDGTDIAVLQAWLLELKAAGALERFLGERAAFFAAFAAFVAEGGTFDGFAGLPANIFAGYAVDLRAFYDFLLAGGVPSDYVLLSPEAIREYIAALEAAGATSSFLGDLAAFYRDYAIYLAGGGDPDLFAGLPVPPDFPAFAAALNAYALFLQGGGLPSDYSAEDLAQLQAFLDALVRSGQLSAFLGDNADLLTRYFAFLAGGGDPDGFVGLPIYVRYIAALNAYYDFLLGGGLPSGYTELDAATIEAYLAALAALQGGLAGIEDLNDFFVDYFIYLAGGGDPDRFAGLPVNGGGGGNPTDPDVPPMLAGYTGGFDAVAPRINFILGGQLKGGTFVGSESGFAASQYSLDADGGLASYTRQPGGQVRNRGAAQQTDIFGNADAVIGRWTNGTIATPNSFTFNENQGLHYMLARPVGPNFTMGLTGRVDYYLIGATRPTIADGSLVPGEFDAGLAIALGSDYRLAMEGTITMPNGSNPYIYSFSTAGGLADPSQSGSVISANAEGAFFASIPGSDNAGNCIANPALCTFAVFANFAGDEETIGMTYEARTGTTAKSIVGAAIFEAGPIRTFDGGGGSTTTRTNQNLAFANLFIGDDAVSGGSVTVDDQGRIIGYQSREREIFEQGTTQIVESGNAAGVTWTRWADGTPTGDYYGTTTFAPVGPNGGWHVIAGDALSNIPTSGTIAYDLTGYTTPTRTGESTSTGSLTGSAAVQFGSTARFGLDLTVTSGADQINMATDGGVTDVGQSRLIINSAGIFSSGAFNPEINTTSIAGDFCAAGCLSFVQGFLSGDGASGAGLSYAIRQEGVIPQGFINGTAAFARGNPIGGGGAATVDGVVPTGGTDSPFAFAGPGSTGEVSSAATMTVTDGVLLQARRGSIRVEYSPTAQSTIEVSGDQGVIGWQRINSVRTVYSGGTGQVFQSNPFPQQYWHTVWGAPLVNLPVSGLVNYEFIGGSTAHQLNARPGDGTFEGRFAVDFATLRAGLEATVTLDGPDAAIYDFASTGGVAAPSMGLLDDGFGTRRFSEILTTTQRGVGAVTRGTNVAGFLAGDGATHAGMTYAIRTSSGNAIVGTAAFRAVGAGSAAASATMAAGAAQAQLSAGVPVAVSTPAPGYDWSRWGRNISAGQATPRRPGILSAIDIALPGDVGIDASADAADRRAAIRQAERLTGGMISFPGAEIAPH